MSRMIGFSSGTPIAEGDQRAGKIDQRGERSETDPIKDNTKDILAQHSHKPVGPTALFASRDEYLDAPVVGAPFRRRVGVDRRVGGLSLDFDTIRIGQALLQHRGRGLGALQR